VEVVVPTRSTRPHSPDPIDVLEHSEHPEYRDIHYGSAGDIQNHSFAPIGAGGAATIDDAFLAPSSGASAGAAVTGHVPSSGTESRRSSARQQTIKDKKAADAAERKRKRAERKAKEAADAAIAHSSGDVLAPTAPAPKRRTKKVKIDQSNGGGDESTAPAPPRQGLDDATPPFLTSSCSSDHDARQVAPRATEACTGPTLAGAADATPEACGGAREAVERPKNPVTEGVISSVEPEFTSEHSSPRRTNPGSPVRSPPGAADKASSSPASVTPNIARVLRPAHNTPPASSTSTPSGGRWRTREWSHAHFATTRLGLVWAYRTAC
jgi:hypothetical protein